MPPYPFTMPFPRPKFMTSEAVVLMIMLCPELVIRYGIFTCYARFTIIAFVVRHELCSSKKSTSRGLAKHDIIRRGNLRDLPG